MTRLAHLAPRYRRQAKTQLRGAVATLRNAGVDGPIRADLGTGALERIAGASPRKYCNEPTTVDGYRFDSKLEARCFQELRLRRMAGEVLWFTRQVPFELPGGVRYRADFLAVLRGGGVEVIDATGFVTSTKKLKLKQVKAIYGVEVQLWPQMLTS